MTAHSVNLQG